MINQQIKVFLFPKEHGGWAILVEALLVGLAFHHSFLSVGMGVMSTLVFLVINPLLKMRYDEEILKRHFSN